MINNLKGKLDALRAQRQVERHPIQEESSVSSCNVQVHHYNLLEPIGNSALEKGRVSADVLSVLTLTDVPSDLKPESILYLDTETTGLSTGAGTVAFLVGVGFYRDGAYHVEQFLLQDYDQEPDMLQRLQRRLDEFSVIATYNGKSYDAPLLETRFVLNRLYPGFRKYIHLDLLHAVRRVYKHRMHPCTLGMAEETLLDIHRVDDIPGEQIPQCFYAYLQDHDAGKMNRIVEHNRQDILTMPLILGRMAEELSKNDDPQMLVAFGRLLEKRGQYQGARDCFKKADIAEAFVHWANMEKSLHHRELAEPLWKKLLEHPKYSLVAAEELAKYYEHECKDVQKAWTVVKKEQLFMKSLGREACELLPRLNRLEKKLAKKEK